jgi:hypothetical protein
MYIHCIGAKFENLSASNVSWGINFVMQSKYHWHIKNSHFKSHNKNSLSKKSFWFPEKLNFSQILTKRVNLKKNYLVGKILTAFFPANKKEKLLSFVSETFSSFPLS